MCINNSMEAEVRGLTYSEIRQSYQTVKDFIESESYTSVKSLNTRIEADLRMAGDDNYELLEKFVERFKLDYKDFDYPKHFKSEGELFGSGAALLTIISLIFWLPAKTIELISFNRIKLFRREEKDKRLDLTFRDMLTWYIEGRYKLGNEVKYKIKHTPTK